MKISQYFKQQVVWWATSKERIAIAGGRGEIGLFSKCVHDALKKVIEGSIIELVRLGSDELYIGGIPALKTWVHKKVCEQATAKLQRRSTEDVAQRLSLTTTRREKPSHLHCLQDPCFPCVLLAMQEIQGGSCCWKGKQLSKVT